MILPTTQELTMNITAPPPVSRAGWLRAVEGTHDVVQAAAAAVRRVWRGWQASRRRALEFRALRQLSPNVLRDIGIAHEVIGEVQTWHEQQSLLSDSIGR